MTFVPIFIHTAPDTCPECGKIEKIKRVCGHCDYEYKEPELEYPYWYASLALNIISLFASFRFMYWTTNFEGWWILPAAVTILLSIILLNFFFWFAFAKEKE